MNRRNISGALLDALADTPVIFLRGAHQFGKTTLVKNLYNFCNIEGSTMTSELKESMMQ
jgi:predicted AAA+ superfamily ATPase